MNEPIPAILKQVASAGHAVFTRGLFNLNIVGIRTPDDSANTFNDGLVVAYKDEHGWITRGPWKWTTDPGTYYRLRPMNVEGTAIMCPGQYRGAYQIGLHRGRPALRQVGPVRIWRDNNRDAILDMDPATVDTGRYAMNIHRSSSTESTVVDRWSAGCQVAARSTDMDCLLSLCRKSAELYGPRFTYTLIEANV